MTQTNQTNKVELIKLYQSNGKVFVPGVYDIESLPPYIRNRKDYVKEVKEIVEEKAEKKEDVKEKKEKKDIKEIKKEGDVNES